LRGRKYVLKKYGNKLGKKKKKQEKKKERRKEGKKKEREKTEKEGEIEKDLIPCKRIDRFEVLGIKAQNISKAYSGW